MRDLIKNLQANCPENHFIQVETVDDFSFKIRKTDKVGFKGKLMCLHTDGVVSCVINQDYIVAVCYHKELPYV